MKYFCINLFIIHIYSVLLSEFKKKKFHSIFNIVCLKPLLRLYSSRECKFLQSFRVFFPDVFLQQEYSYNITLRHTQLVFRYFYFRTSVPHLAEGMRQILVLNVSESTRIYLRTLSRVTGDQRQRLGHSYFSATSSMFLPPHETEYVLQNPTFHTSVNQRSAFIKIPFWGILLYLSPEASFEF